MEGSTMTISTIAAAIGEVFTTALSWVGDVATTVGENPLLLFYAILPCVGLGIGVFKRLLNVH